MPLPWRSTGGRARARCCAACWRGSAGCGAPRRSGWRARAASRKRAVVWAKRRCAGCTRKWCAPLLPAPARERGIETGDWSAWTGPAWRWPTPWRTGANLACPGPAAVRALSRNCVSWRWWRMARTCCSAPVSGPMPAVRRRWPARCWRRCGRACCAWPTGSSSAMHSGRKPLSPAPACSGGRRKSCGYRAKWGWPPGPAWPRSLPAIRTGRIALVGGELAGSSAGRRGGAAGGRDKDRRHRTGGVRVRVIEYRLEGVAGVEPLYRLVTTIFDPAKAPAAELAALYHERWEIEGALAELKTHLRGAQVVLRSKTPELVRQEFWGLLLAHFAVRGLMHEAALRADEDPDRLSFLHAVRVVRRKLPLFAALSPSGQARPA